MSLVEILKTLWLRNSDFVLSSDDRVVIDGWSDVSDLLPHIKARRRQIERWVRAREQSWQRRVASRVRGREVVITGRFDGGDVRRGDLYTMQEAIVLAGADEKTVRLVDKVKQALDGRLIP